MKKDKIPMAQQEKLEIVLKLRKVDSNELDNIIKDYLRKKGFEDLNVNHVSFTKKGVSIKVTQK